LLIARDKGTGSPIGEFSYGHPDQTAGTVRIGLKIATLGAQKKGYGKEGLIGLCRYLFETLDVLTILIDTFTLNTLARRLYESLGASESAIKEAYWTNPEGTSFDVIFYDLTKDMFYQHIGQ